LEKNRNAIIGYIAGKKQNECCDTYISMAV